MYSEQYPSLYKALPYENFEVIVETIDKYFGQLFNLQVLEQEIKQKQLDGSYVAFFMQIAKQLQAKPNNDLYTVEQVSQKIYSILQNDETVRKCFLEQLIFVPPLNNEPSTQLGFQEKLANGRLKVPEAVTYLDMLRISFFLQRARNANWGNSSNSYVAVMNLASTTPGQYAEHSKDKRAVVVNLNMNLKDTPKWAVINLSDPIAPEIYCENPLLESERRELEARCGSTFKEVSPGKADNLISTGYTAIAWLDQNITHGWNFDTNADFNVLFGDYALMIFGCDAGGVHFKCVNNYEHDEYMTQGLKNINDAQYGPGREPQSGSKKWGSFTLYRMAGFATLDKIEGEAIPYNDLAKVIEVVGRRQLSTNQFEQYSGLGFRSKIPRFSHTLTQFGHPVVLEEDFNQVTLNVPNKISFHELRQAHSIACSATRTDSALLRFINRDPLSTNYAQEDMATAMVLTLFRTRAKKAVLDITLPKAFNLNAQESQMIVRLMQDNAFVTELHINQDNKSLCALKAELLPVLARNRWLAANNYLPPLVDNYWQRAAKYWLIHLNEHRDILSNKVEHELFKRCVEEMGVLGLKAVLSYLSDSEASERLLGIYGNNRPEFYLACQPNETKDYLTLVTDHLKQGSTFPFAHLGAAYQPGSDKNYLELFGFVNQKSSFETVKLTDCLRHKKAFAAFLKTLSATAQKDAWTGLIVIPELDDEATVGEEYRELRALYRHLNNIILHNRHLKQGAELAIAIKDVSKFDEIIASEAGPQIPGKVVEVNEAAVLSFGDNVPDSWPLQRGGAVQLQLQQQQEIQQSRQMQQERQKMQMHLLEEVISSELVTYDTIDRLMGEFYKKYVTENACSEEFAALWSAGSETLLQGFFHTWINANPAVKAKHAVQSMTQDAVKMLLRHHTRVSSGVHLENLPKGFYTQRSKNGGLILCYNAELGFSNSFVTPLTPMMAVSRPVAELWEGDFRLFNVEHYLTHDNALKNADDFKNLAVFEMLQPQQDYQSHFERFCTENPDVAAMLGGYEDKVQAHWLVFLQAWQYQGIEGVETFLNLREEELTLDTRIVCDILFQKQSPQLTGWVTHQNFDIAFLRAIGQVYYRLGDEPVGLLIAKLQQLEGALGDEFFQRFKQTVLNRSDNFNSFVNPAFFTAMDDLITRLSPANAAANRNAFLSVLNLHLDCVGWEAFETLWSAFDYFTKELTDMGLQLEGDEFDGLDSQNMLVGLDRILATLRSLAAQDERTLFLNSLAELDLTLGGVHYAIQHEGFQYFDDSLKLHDFAFGTPTYAPNLSALYDWDVNASALNIQRVLASRTQFSHADYRYLAQEFANGSLDTKNQFVWLLFTQYDMGDVRNTLTQVRALPASFVSLIGQHIHQAVFQHGHEELNISLRALLQFENELDTDKGQLLLQRYPHGNFLEALSILSESDRADDIQQVLALFEANIVPDDEYPAFLFQDVYKLATLFGVCNPEQVRAFIAATSHLKVAVLHELHLLIKHVLSVNYASSDKNALVIPGNWTDLLQCIEAMNNKPADRTLIRKAFIDTLTDKGIAFKFSRSGDFRNLVHQDYPACLSVFIDHQHRMWTFLKDHIVVPASGDAQDALRPLLAFFQRLQLNRTYLNEIEPLLAILEKTPKERVWSASYLSQMIDVLKPDNDQVAFPLDMLQVMLKDEGLTAQAIDNAEKDFPKALVTPLKGILSNATFTRAQQAGLCQLALKEYHLTKTNPLLKEVIDLLSPDNRVASREYALQILTASNNINEISNRIDKLKKLLNHSRSTGVVNSQWENTTALWIKAMAARKTEETLFSKVMNALEDEHADKRARLLHIVAWSSLHPGLRSHDDFKYELDSKAPKLIAYLLDLSDEDLNLLCSCYPKQPAPGAVDLLHLLKEHRGGQDFKVVLNKFLCNPHPEVRADYKQVVKTRQSDLQRMLTETRITEGEHSKLLDPVQVGRISLMFLELKRLESGEQFVEGCKKSVSSMNQEELAAAFKRLSAESLRRGQDDLLQAQIWALLFEALGRTTRKYPHMAQQFALIANDIAVSASTRVLRLATGEGKSHFVALRAARLAAQGMVVDVCTAKRSLAERDLEDYQDLFRYLELTATYIEPKSSREDYLQDENAAGRIHYSTLGDLSLFLDEQSFQGHPIVIDPKKRVGLGDELDFIYFDEGRKTEYNYARPTGRTPKQMMWFYQAVNEFYTTHAELLSKEQIKVGAVQKLVAFLHEQAFEDEDKERFINQLTRDGLQLVRWLQSAHEAHQLEKGIGFTVREENIKVGDARYLMKEIIPLSTDNQKMIGSTFSAGVQQLLAVRLNTEAKHQGESQNYHVHSESNIISSQVAAKHMRTLWGNWEGFTGTVSSSQAQALHREQGTQVLQVSTNQRDLRSWNEPGFYMHQQARMRALIKQLRECMDKKQSILFSCKNDLQVLWLKEALTAELKEHELSSLIFYTNEDAESSSEILGRKTTLEQWKGGKKQQAVGLVASGFGRGDNVNVEAVFLIDANDINDLKQKGGRTARNGEEGEVFQFYLTCEMEEEEKGLMQIIRYTPGINQQELGKTLELVDGDTEDNKRFNRIMLLREYVFNLQNAANQGFRSGVAQFSGYGMTLIGTFIDPIQASEFTGNLTSAMRQLDKQWLTISSKEGLTPDEKVREIEAVIKRACYDLTQDYQGMKKLGDSQAFPFEFRDYPEIVLSMIPEKQDVATAESHDLAYLGALLASLSLKGAEQQLLVTIPEKLGQLAKNPLVLHEFTRDVSRLTSVSEFVGLLNIRLAQLSKPAQQHESSRKTALVTPTEKSLFKKIDSTVKEHFFASMQKLLPALQDQVEEWLRKPGFASETMRVEKALPLVRYLATFSESEQRRWGVEYLQKFDAIWHHSTSDLLAKRLSGTPMIYADNATLWNLASLTSPGNEKDLFTGLQDAVKESPVHRIRMLTRCEGWLNQLPLEQRAPLLQAFTNVMSQFVEGRDWDIFIKLVDKTSKLWGVNNGSHRTNLIALWQELSQKNLSGITDLVDSCLCHQGKAWFKTLSLALALPPVVANKLTQEQGEHLLQILGEKTGEQALGQYFTAQGRQLFLNSLSRLLEPWVGQFDFTQQTSRVLETMTGFLHQLAAEEGANVIAGACWYLDSTRMAPEIRDNLDSLVASLNRNVALDVVVRELSHYKLTGSQASTLLRVCREGSLNQIAFSASCHGMDIVYKMLNETSLLSKEEKDRYQQQMLALTAPKLVALLKNLASNQAELKANPQVLTALLGYANNPGVTASRLERLTSVLLQVAETSTKTPGYLQHLIEGVSRFQGDNYSDADVERLLILLKGNDALSPEQVLFDNVAQHLESRVGAGQQQAVKSTIDLFYGLAKTHRGNVERMFNFQESAGLVEMFDFKHQREALHNQRVIWMHLLNHKAFVTGSKPQKELDSHVFQWSSAQNEQMLQLGFNLYLEETNTLLIEKPRAAVSLERDLTVSQQCSLLRLADELAIIGKPHLNMTVVNHKATEDNISSMKSGIEKLTGSYQASWFKADSRTIQVANLQTQMTQAFNNASAGSYEKVLNVIRQARITAMQEDIVENKKRTFHLNSSGHSRYFSTLNQMEDLVVRHWVKDVDALQRFQKYKGLCQDNLLDLTGELYGALKTHYEQTYLHAYDERNNRLGQRIANWFAAKDQDVLLQFRNTLYTFNANYRTDGEPLTEADLREMTSKMKAICPQLPGHLQTLAKEVLMRSDSLITHLGEEAKHPTKPILGMVDC